MVPDVHRDDRRLVVLVHEQREAVLETNRSYGMSTVDCAASGVAISASSSDAVAIWTDTLISKGEGRDLVGWYAGQSMSP